MTAIRVTRRLGGGRARAKRLLVGHAIARSDGRTPTARRYDGRAPTAWGWDGRHLPPGGVAVGTLPPGGVTQVLEENLIPRQKYRRPPYSELDNQNQQNVKGVYISEGLCINGYSASNNFADVSYYTTFGDSNLNLGPMWHMACKILEGVQMNESLNQDQRQQFSKQISSVVSMIKDDSSSIKEDDPATKDHAYVAGVCITPLGHILTSSHIVKPGVRYVATCTSWKAGWTSVRLVKISMAYGLCLLQLEHKSRKKCDYINLAEAGILSVNQHVYGFGHPQLFGIECENTFVRGSVEYPCEDIPELPSFSEIDKVAYEKLIKKGLKINAREARALTPRKAKHLMCLIDSNFQPETIYLMNQDIPMIQIKNFHFGYCGSPVFVASGHIVGIVLFNFHEINFAVHLSAIKKFLEDIDLMSRHVGAPSSSTTPSTELVPPTVTTTETVTGDSDQGAVLEATPPLHSPS
uniref:Peptidase S1 domain-containing protein n=1 Tax=Leersia perrieri TaxID=77586 RepID=A0A0D9VWB9_9ORYZ